jgi:hypothetical protein
LSLTSNLQIHVNELSQGPFSLLPISLIVKKKKKKKIVEEEVHLLCLKPVLDFSLDAWNCLRIGIRIAI